MLHRPVVGLEPAAAHLGLDRLHQASAEAHAPRPGRGEDLPHQPQVQAAQLLLVEAGEVR
jgi:hypothetical protein